ncbi:hypothetical protein LTR12_012122 [Friedmanniomyces endolithicus]|nr:hypothetical protein LTR74_001595 [Friedmanniomyces endolithicus]KAK1813474.1 hypothetical protein LTR12_012122 [Friedmanniomyces endolithicus]
MDRFTPMFDHFRAELDEHHDRRERITKASRDITAASKKIIFTLQRVRTLNQPLPQHAVKANKQYYEAITAQISAVSKDLQGLNAWRYNRQITGGCQEWMEAACFQHYLETASLLSHDDAAQKLRELDPNGPGIRLSPEDWVLGVYDMTGELMRFAITAMATSGELPSIGTPSSDDAMDVEGAARQQRNVLTDMRGLRAALEGLDTGFGPLAKDASMKMRVMQTSVEKVEKALYGLIVRGAERPKGWMPEIEGGGGRAVEVEG